MYNFVNSTSNTVKLFAQLQDFEAAVKQRDGIITQLTDNLQQARKEKDEILQEFLDLTEQSQKLQIQFQQVKPLFSIPVELHFFCSTCR